MAITKSGHTFQLGSINSPLRNRPVFIVGVSRSGTTLMRNILNRSQELAICNENNFLGHLISRTGIRHRLHRFGDLRQDDNARRVVEALYSGQLTGRSRTASPYWKRHWRWMVNRIHPDEILERFLESDRSERAFFRIIMEIYSDFKKRPGIGEKTPAHFRYVSTILDWFPDGRIIHMVRDPRAIFVSELRRRRQNPVSSPYRELKRFPSLFRSFVLVETTWAWFDSIRRLPGYTRRFPQNYLVVRFEDLVREPGTYIRGVCDFINISFRTEMLRQAVVSQGFTAGRPGFDPAAAERWREHIDSWSHAWLRTFFRAQLTRLGYEA